MAGNDGQKRRRVLQNIGIGSAATLSSIPVTGAARNDKKQDLVGLSYDTLTHGTGAEATGQIPSQDYSNGVIEVAGFSIPFGKLNKHSVKSDRIASRYVGVLDDEEFVSKDNRLDQNIPLKVHIDQNEDCISGMLSRPSGGFGRLGFYLISPDKLNDKKGLFRPNTAPEWEDHPLNFEVPSEGLPTDSSPGRLLKYKKGQRKSEARKNEMEGNVSTTSTSADSGVLTEFSHQSTLDGDCVDTDYQVNFGVQSDIKKYHEYDEIEEGDSNTWRFYVYFGNRPNDIFECDSINYIRPSNYSLHVEPFYDDQKDYIHFSHPQPDDEDGQTENEELGLALDLIGSGNLAGVGASIAKYIMSGSGSSTTVNYYDSGTIYDFDVDLDGSYDDLPRELSDECQTTQFSLRVNNEWPADDMLCSIEFQPEYTFYYADSTSCTSCYSATPVGMYKTVTPDWSKAPEAWYDSVDKV
ncbi:hypothetical protein [Natrinema hispanicum]|uniref:Uncharacterized protein n=1 Tax=Natrinema hispanicum TaxID=392421 RepID=A0A1I0J9L6_9EURY|nr:hypothetical protein [Natrinema hispanicum]RZV05171.1 hypothetical protein BDK88_4190 [Natrinema hispanicum]SDD86256.1 hypothetical protein SAMN05192552_10606 [Natrinema hispanicum]SEU06566.1 hypothetical protein SAMN04488694_13522 [Natrinema hispanicum]